jgi:hypothetical protein
MQKEKNNKNQGPINEIETDKTIQRINETKICFLMKQKSVSLKK